MTAMNELTQRLNQLERQNERLRYMLCGFLLCSVAVLLLGAAVVSDNAIEGEDVTFGTIRAQRVAVMDGDGRERLILELDAGEPTLTMRNHAGMEQVYLGINENWNDTAMLSVSSRLDNGSVDKQAVLATTKSRAAAPGFRRDARPGNSQLLLYDLAPQQKNAARRHVLRLSTGLYDAQKPYMEIYEYQEGSENHLSFDVLMAKPEAAGQRFLLDTTGEETTLSGVAK